MANTTTKIAGLTNDQMRMLFERIATSMNLMADLCRSKAEELGEHDAALTFNALDTMLCGVGAMADMATGGTIVGSFSDWMLGPNFNQVKDAKGKSLTQPGA